MCCGRGTIQAEIYLLNFNPGISGRFFIWKLLFPYKKFSGENDIFDQNVPINARLLRI